ncbi:hypothetical protein D3C75_1250310 [compost metagenome]
MFADSAEAASEEDVCSEAGAFSCLEHAVNAKGAIRSAASVNLNFITFPSVGDWI